MTTPLRVVQSGSAQRDLIQQAADLSRVMAAHQARGQVISDERKRVLRELYLGGMDWRQIAKATGIKGYDVRRLLGLRK